MNHLLPIIAKTVKQQVGRTPPCIEYLSTVAQPRHHLNKKKNKEDHTNLPKKTEKERELTLVLKSARLVAAL